MTDEKREIYDTIYFLNTYFCEETLQSFEKENIAFSPVLLQTFLSMIFQDQTYRYRNNFKSALRLWNNEDLYIKYYKEFISFLHSINNESFSLTGKIFVNDNFKLQDNFKNIVNAFRYEIDTVDFNKKETCTKIIDYWVEDKTRSLVRDLTSNNNLNESTHLALLDVACFKGNWDSTFNIELNTRSFHLNANDSIETQMMKMTGEVYYKFDEDNSITAIELPFTSEKFSLILILPDKGKCPIDTLWRVTENMTKKMVDISLPKFKVEQLMDCRNIFPKLRLKEEFQDNVYLFDMLQSDEFLKYAQIEEKGFINIDEEGIEAASGLLVTMVPVEFDKEYISPDGLKMPEITIKTTISNRFAKTLVTCRVQNNDKSAKEATFNVVLPEKAFITEFIMEMNGKKYKSYIKGVEEAKAIYDEALAKGRSAGIVAADTRDSTQFNVSVNLEPQSVAVFLLTYEEMLQRIHDQYELVLNIFPRRIVDIINVEVNINESRRLTFVKTPPLRSGKEVNKTIEQFLVPSSDVKIINSNSSVVKFSADVKQQQKICTYFGTPTSDGFTGQFVVQYDVEREPKDGEILLQDGYFVHFFAPNDLDPLPKHIVFVLDTSTSMIGRKLDQLKDAMMSILNDVRDGDLISIIEFNGHVIIWDIESEKSKVITCNQFQNFLEPFQTLGEFSLPSSTLANDATISKAKNVVQSMFGQGTTFMIGGLEVALYMVKDGQDKVTDKSSKYQPIMVFLTDGYPNIGCGSTSEITRIVTQLNMKNNNVPIFSLSFGERADKSFLRELSLKNFGFSRHIYEASDASLQLQSFYKQISSPLLSDIRFKYESDVTEVTRSHFPIYFKGGELVVSGQCRDCQLSSTINGCGPRGYLNLGSIIKNPVTSLEKLWAYMTVKQLLEERNITDNKEELTKRAVELALKYSFVTEVTSLVVVKPDEICDTNADTDQGERDFDNLGIDGSGKKKVIRKRVIKKQIARDQRESGEIMVVEEPERVKVFDNLGIDGSGKKKVIRKRVIKKQIARDQDLEGCMIEELSESVEVTEVLPPKKSKILKFVADHPFLVAIALKREDRRILIFVGRVQKPL